MDDREDDFENEDVDSTDQDERDWEEISEVEKEGRDNFFHIDLDKLKDDEQAGEVINLAVVIRNEEGDWDEEMRGNNYKKEGEE